MDVFRLELTACPYIDVPDDDCARGYAAAGGTIAGVEAAEPRYCRECGDSLTFNERTICECCVRDPRGGAPS